MTGRSGSDFSDTYGPWAVITGASAGIGRALAGELARRGVDLVLVARRGDVLEQVGAALRAQHGIRTRVVAADVRHDTGAVLRATDDLDVGLYVAAAGFGTSGDFLSSDLGAERDMLAVNCAAVLELTWHYARRFTSRRLPPRRAGIVLLSSIVAYQGQAHAAHYAATKAWVHTLAEGLHRELAGRDVDVLAAAPGPVASEFATRADMRMTRALDPGRIAGPILDALVARRTTALPGALSRLLRGSLAPLPRPARVRIMSAVMAGMTRHQRRDGDHPAER